MCTALTIYKDTVYGGTIAIGSSIMRKWENIQEDLAPFNVVNQAFGGARTWELLYYAEKLITNFQPKVVLIYCGSNDINAGEKAEPIVERVESAMDYLSRALPGVKIVYIAINKAPQKRDRWDIVD